MANLRPVIPIASSTALKASSHKSGHGNSLRGADAGGAKLRATVLMLIVVVAVVPPAATVAGEGEQVTPTCGEAAQAKETGLVNTDPEADGVTVTKKLVLCPGTTTCDTGVAEMVKSVAATTDETVVVAFAVLLALAGSVVVVVALTLALTVPAAVAVTMTVAVTVAPLAKVPMVQVTVPAASVHVPALALALTKVVFAGSAEVATTLAAAEGPLLPTVTV